jgi:hypothetical protein
MEPPVQGWQPDPLGRHSERWMSAGAPTELVRDGHRVTHDPVTSEPSRATMPPDAEPAHWIDVGALPRKERAPLPWPLRRLPPSYPTPEPRRWRVVLGVGLTCCSLLATLAIHFGHALVPPPPLGRDEAIGVVQVVAPHDPAFLVSYQPPGTQRGTSRGDTNYAFGWSTPGTVQPGQSVVVHYDLADDTKSTIVALAPPQSRPNGLYGWVVVGVAWAVTAWYWISTVFRKGRRYQRRVEDTDYRDDPWTGSTNSA